MSREPRAVRSTCLITDIEGFRTRDAATQREMQRRLVTMTEWGLRKGGIRRYQARYQDRGDGQLVILPAGIDEFTVVPTFILSLRDALADSNREGSIGRMRVRLALAQGVVQDGYLGVVSRAVVVASTIVDADALRRLLTASRHSDLAVALTDDIYTDVVVPKPTPLSDRAFTAVSIPAKNNERIGVHIQALHTVDAKPAGRASFDPTVAGFALAGIGLPGLLPIADQMVHEHDYFGPDEDSHVDSAWHPEDTHALAEHDDGDEPDDDQGWP
ncbi:hypothetical protein [Kineosporia babensis]|uniref:Guanylate cyclase domain-containing protein n=1 Tax=Kineosporia babensis TaxID=499548 RepID=A0A9X1N8Z1_9ACTN|nr:hypothetical protein [Kineosporia babensis]MCD5310712.1 hypothetical protein [Kineosporia babensis]